MFFSTILINNNYFIQTFYILLIVYLNFKGETNHKLSNNN